MCATHAFQSLLRRTAFRYIQKRIDDHVTTATKATTMRAAVAAALLAVAVSAGAVRDVGDDDVGQSCDSGAGTCINVNSQVRE